MHRWSSVHLWLNAYALAASQSALEPISRRIWLQAEAAKTGQIPRGSKASVAPSVLQQKWEDGLEEVDHAREHPTSAGHQQCTAVPGAGVCFSECAGCYFSLRPRLAWRVL